MTLIYDMPDRDYHARPELSSTQARQILDSPARYKWALTQPPRTSDAFDLGHAVHSKVLGVGAKVVLYPDEHITDSGAISKSKASLAWQDKQRAAGLTPITSDQQLAVNQMAENVLAHHAARALFEQPGHAEASVFATCDETSIDVRARFDYLPELDTPDPIAVDVKTTAGTIADFDRSVAKWRYDVQQGHYIETLRLETNRDDIRFAFLVIEKAAPYFVGIRYLDTEFTDIGIEDARNARRTLRDCTDTNTWPTGYETPAYIGAPFWLRDDLTFED